MDAVAHSVDDGHDHGVDPHHHDHQHGLAPARKWFLPVLSGVGLLGVVGYLFAFDPNEEGHYLGCPLKMATGIACPGCGGIRAVHAMLHGDFVTSLQRNPLAIPVVLLIVVFWTKWALNATGIHRTKPLILPNWIPIILGVGMLVLFLSRNIDWGPFPWFEDPTATKLLFG